MKTLLHLGRHKMAVMENGIELERASGRENIWTMRKRHGLTEIKKVELDKTEIPTGFEEK